MSTEMSTNTNRAKRTHPFRGAICGLIFGVALTLFLITASAYQWTSDVPAILLVTATTVLGSLWGLLGPTRKSRSHTGLTGTDQPAPTTVSSVP